MTDLSQELAADPLGLGYASHLPDSPGLVVEMLNAPTGPGAGAAAAQQMTKGALLLRIVPILDQLALGVGLDGSVILPQVDRRWTQRFAALQAGDPAIDITPQLVGMLRQAVADHLTTDEYIDAILTRQGSRAEVLGLGVITEADVRIALGE